MLSMISELYQGQNELPVQPKVEPGFLRESLLKDVPEEGADFDTIFEETRQKIFPGLKMWNHPNFFAYYPSGSSHATILADMFASAFNAPGFVWHSSPSITELENIVLDWCSQLFGLPDIFLLKNQGGGTIVNSVSDAIFHTCHAAKLRKMKELEIELTDPRVLRFVGYYTQHSFPSCEKSLKIKDIAYRRVVPINFDEGKGNFKADSKKFEEMVKKDLEDGLVPFWFNSTLGTTPTCAYDELDELDEVCKKYKIWHNCDSAYAGVCWVDEKHRVYSKELASLDSLIINCAKFMMLGNVATIMYVRDKEQFQKSFSPNETFEVYKNQYSENNDVIDYSNWSPGFGRRFNALKFYYVMRHFGKKGLQEHIREKIALTQYFEGLLKSSKYFKLFTKLELTLITFRLHPDGEQTTEKLNDLNKKFKVLLDQNTQIGYITPSSMKDIYFLRFVLCNPNSTQESILEFFKYLEHNAEELLKTI